MVLRAVGAPDRVADAHPAEAAQLRDLARPHFTAADERAVGEDVETGDDVAEHPIPQVHGPGQHAHVGDPLARVAAFDLEHRALLRAALRGGGQQPGDAGGEVLDARAGDRRAEEDGVDERAAGLVGQRGSTPARRDPTAVDVRGEQGVVVLGQHGEVIRVLRRDDGRRGCPHPRPRPRGRRPG